MATRKPKKAQPQAEEAEDLVESGLEAADDSDDDDSNDVSASADFDGDSDSDDDSSPATPDDHLVDYSVKSREATRAALNAQIEEYLSRGGKINHVDNNVTADPPRKPTSNYGSRPI